MILEVYASVFLPNLPFGTIGPFRPHDAECTLELQLQPYWLTLDLLVGDGMGVENHAPLWFVMWMVAFPDRGDHALL